MRAVSERVLAVCAAPARAAGRHGTGRHGAELARHAPARRAAARGRRLAGQRPVRGLLVTPWFAAGAGIVVAALLTLAMPHPQLSFGPPAPAQQPCGDPRCVAPARHELGSLATAKPVRVIATPRPRRLRRPRARPRPAAPAAPVVVVHFQLLRDDAQGFIASITVLSSRRPGTWSLAFELPGTRIVRVWGASWHPSASGDGGVVTGQPWAVQQPGGGSARFAILGIGPPRQPRGCVFDGARCTFR